MSEQRSYRAGGPRTVWRDTGEEAVVLDLGASVYFGLNSSGALLWRRLIDGATAEELAGVLLAHTAADPARVGEDVRAFLDALNVQGLLHSP